MKIIVFDIGGTLMEYRGMPHSWIDYYEAGLHAVNKKYQFNVSNSLIEKSTAVLKSYNPRVNYREIEYTPQQIFCEAIKDWDVKCSIDEIINTFYAALTDLPTAMPDELFQRDIHDLLQYFDLYVSSLSCGYRKPNPYGLKYMAKELRCSCKELLFVGDEEKDRMTAKNAGCRFLKIVRDEKAEDNIFTLKDVNGR